MDFHEDLFPDVFRWGGVAPEEWFQGNDLTREKVSMDPAKKPKAPSDEKPSQQKESELSQPVPQPESQPPCKDGTPSKAIQTPKSHLEYTRKFLTGHLHHPSTSFTSLPQPHSTTPLLRTTSTSIAYLLPAPGRIALLALSKPDRIESPPTIDVGGSVTDFALCPFDVGLVAVAVAGDGCVKVLKLEDEGWGEVGRMEGERVVQVEWHPFIMDFVAVLYHSPSGCHFRLWDFAGTNSKTFPLTFSVLPPNTILIGGILLLCPLGREEGRVHGNR
jgi:hypothetical protein